MRHDNSYLIDVLQAARKARAFAADLTYPQFQQSDLHQNAILKVLEIIGEAAKLPLASRQTPTALIRKSHGVRSSDCATASSTVTSTSTSI